LLSFICKSEPSYTQRKVISWALEQWIHPQFLEILEKQTLGPSMETCMESMLGSFLRIFSSASGDLSLGLHVCRIIMQFQKRKPDLFLQISDWLEDVIDKQTDSNLVIWWCTYAFVCCYNKLPQKDIPDYPVSLPFVPPPLRKHLLGFGEVTRARDYPDVRWEIERKLVPKYERSFPKVKEVWHKIHRELKKQNIFTSDPKHWDLSIGNFWNAIIKFDRPEEKYSLAIFISLAAPFAFIVDEGQSFFIEQHLVKKFFGSMQKTLLEEGEIKSIITQVLSKEGILLVDHKTLTKSVEILPGHSQRITHLLGVEEVLNI